MRVTRSSGMPVAQVAKLLRKADNLTPLGGCVSIQSARQKL